MSLNMKSLTQALAKTAAVIEKTVQTTVQEVTGPKPLQDYDLLDQIGSAGPALAWKLYSAKSSRDSTRPHQYPNVCVWVLDKRAISEARARAGLSKTTEDAFFDIIRSDASRLVRLRHPGVLHVIQALDENKNAMAMVTEPLFASVANALGNHDNIAQVPKELKGMEMGLLEVKHGLLQIAESLDFLHNNARLIHRSISPENVLITSSGAWKLGGFGFATSSEQGNGDLANIPAFHYAEYDVEDSILPLQPSLNYTAPELVRSKTPAFGSSSDIFSFGCLAYHLIVRRPLFDCHNNVKMEVLYDLIIGGALDPLIPQKRKFFGVLRYMNTLTYLSREAFSSVPPELVSDLQRMLSANESFRPTAIDFTGSLFFRDDTRLRALRFLDHLLERDNMQKSEFLKALGEMWKDFDSRVLRYKVLPPLCAELRNVVMQPMILPMVLTIAESQDKIDFELSTLPALVPVLSAATGETLLMLVRHAELIINKTSQEQLVSHVLPFVVRAFDDNDARIQEEVLKKSIHIAKQLDAQLVKQTILRRVHGLALRTTVAAVRVNALLCLADLVPTLDKHAALDILQTIQRCTAVDHSAPTLMCTLGVASSMLRQYGVEFASEHVLPLLIPLLTAQQLNVQQFAKYMAFVKDILRKIEEKRGVTLSDSGLEIKSPTLSNGLQSQTPSKGSSMVTASTKSAPSWDEDWGPKAKVSSSPTSTTFYTSSSNQSMQSSPLQVQSSTVSVESGLQSATTCAPAADIEWPPRAPQNIMSQLNDTQKQLPEVGSSSASSFDEIDPFADWPPRPSGSTVSSSFNNGTVATAGNQLGLGVTGVTNSASAQNSSYSSWGFSQSLNEPPRINQANLGLVNANGIINAQNSVGYMKQTQGNLSLGTSDKKSSDISSIFGLGKIEQTAPRLAPPPATAVGRGRGRGIALQSASRPKTAKLPSEQPPLLDLL